MVRITIDGKPLEVEAGKTIIQAAHEAGITIPYYCYHPGMVVDGNCRICLVEIEKQPKLSVACKTPVQEGMVIHTQSEKVREGRRHVLEFLLINHPIDCPVCDQAGECKLQDYYYDYDLARSRFKDRKLHKPKVVPLGKEVMFDGERCILCSRCVRFTRDITETHELLISGRGDRSLITLAPGKTLDNPYSMNVVDICPVGALTSRDFRFKKRVWFLESRESLCPGCSRCCAIHVDYDPRENRIYRLRPRKNLWVNQYWMCDDGRYTYRRTQEKRLLTARISGKECSMKEAISRAQELLLSTTRRGGTVGIVLSPSLTLEELYLLRLAGERFKARFMVGEDFRVEDGYRVKEDDFLIEGDKHPNRKGVEWLFGKELSGTLEGCEILIVLGRSYRDLGKTLSSPALVITPWVDPYPREPEVLLPGLTSFEKAGSFLNFQGILQGFGAVLNPPPGIPGERETLRELLEPLGVELPSSLEEIWARLSLEYPELAGLDHGELRKRKAIALPKGEPLWMG